MKNKDAVIQLLTEIGWNKNYLTKSDQNLRSAVVEFQRGFGFGLLVADGDPGALTMSALEHSAAQGGRCTPNFKYSEFKSRYGIIRLHSSLPRGLEVVREKLMNGAGLHIINGYRDPRHNREVGGASRSVHLSGAAVDATLPHISKVKSLGIFSGIGATTADGVVRHVDLRNVDEHSRRSGGSPTQPAVWGYLPTGRTTNSYPRKWNSYPANGPGLPPLLTWKGNGTSKPAPVKPTVRPAVVPPVVEPKPSGDAAELAEIKGRVSQIETAVATVRTRIAKLEQSTSLRFYCSWASPVRYSESTGLACV